MRIVGFWLVALVVVLGCTPSEESASLDGREETGGTPSTPDSIGSEAAPPGDDPTDLDSSSDENVPTCGSDQDHRSVMADLDGDGLDDEVLIYEKPDGTSTLTVCPPGAGRLDLGGGNKPVEVHILDIEGDGTEELLVGAPFGAGPFAGGVVRFSDSDPAYSGEWVDVVPAGDGRTGRSFGCVDLDGDGLTELVTLHYRFDGETLDDSSAVSWQRFPVAQDGGPPEAEGVFDIEEDGDAVAALLSGTCRDQVIIA